MSPFFEVATITDRGEIETKKIFLITFPRLSSLLSLSSLSSLIDTPSRGNLLFYSKREAIIYSVRSMFLSWQLGGYALLHNRTQTVIF
jgi:hypothetical protein